MSDINSRIEASKEKVTALEQQIEQAQVAKRDKSLAIVARANGPLAGLRSPPATKLRRTLKGHFGKVTSMQWGGDSTHLVSASQDGNILVWNAMTSNKIQSISLKSSYVMAVGIEQSHGRMIACGGLDNLCTIYKLNQPDKAFEMASHDGFLSSCRFISEESIITSSGDSTCIRWDIALGKPVDTFVEHKAVCMGVSLKPGDRNVFVSCSVDQTVKVWDIRTPQASVATFKCHTDDINAVEFMPADGNVFATCSDDSVCLFDIRACNEINRFGTPNAKAAEGVPTEGYTSLSFSRSGRIIYCGHSEGSVLAYDTLSDKKTPVFSLNGAHERHVSCVGVSPNGDALCSGSWDSNIKIWA